MRNSLIALSALVLVLPAPSLQAQPATAPSAGGIAVGQVLDNLLTKTVNGWLQFGIMSYPKRVTRGYVTSETMECCVVLYQRGNSYIVARAAPVLRSPQGEVKRFRIEALHRLTARPDEEQVECRLPGNWTFLTLKDPKTGWLRSVVMDRDAFVSVTWQDPGSYCSYGD